jgi:hypothetical protein
MCCNSTCSDGMGGICRSGPSSGAYCSKHVLFAFRSHRNAMRCMAAMCSLNGVGLSMQGLRKL